MISLQEGMRNIMTQQQLVNEKLSRLNNGEGTVFGFLPYPFNYLTRRLTIDEILDKFIDEGKREHEEMEIFIKEFRTTNELLLKERSNLLSELKIENEPTRFEQDVQEKPHDDGVKNKSSSIRERTTQPLNLKQLDINILFIEALVQIQKYAEYLKSLLTNKSKLKEAYIETMNERCSNVFLNKLPLKEKDPRSFNIHCRVLEKHKKAEDLAQITYLVNTYFWEEPYAFKLSAYNIMKRCVTGSETLEILAHCHSGPTGGHHSVLVTANKVYESEFYWPSVFKDANEYVRRCDACQRSGNISSRNGMPQNNIQVCEVFDVWGLDFMGPFPESRERSEGYNPKGWSEKLYNALGAFRTTYKTPTGCTPFRLVYGKACHLPVEIEHKAHWALKQCNMDLTLASESRLMQLNELAKLRDGAYENNRIYKERTKKWHDSRIRGDKDFKVGDKVLLYNSRLKMYPRKLKSKLSGPNIVKTVYPYGAVEIIDKNGFNFKANRQRLKKYYDGNIDKEDDEVIEFENGVT
ncbi:reverse transcriptase domain-containing protein [Tanacetum coccineum]